MSGLPTLRILCMTAMAPALTESASTRLKLQERFVTQDPPIVQSTEENNSHRRKITPYENHKQSDCSKGSRLVSHLSFVNVNGTHFDPEDEGLKLGLQVPPVATPTTPNRTFKAVKFSNTRLSKLSSLNIKNSQLNQFYKVGKDYKISLVKDKDTYISYIDNLKIMNQPHIAAEISKYPVCAVESGVESVGLEKKEPPPSNAASTRLVNEDHCSVSGSEKSGLVCCNEKGDKMGKNINEGVAPAIPKGKGKATLKQPSMGIGLGRGDQLFSSQKPQEDLEPNNDKMNEEMRKDCSKKQVYLEKKVMTLLRRLKRVKGKVVESHTKEQLRQFVNYQHRNLQMVAKIIKKETPGPEELKEHFLSNDDVKNMSSTQLVKLVKSYQSNKLISSQDPYSEQDASCSNSAIFMDTAVRSQSLKTSERLANRIQIAKAELDSDATVSSSGGESGEEEEEIPVSPLPSDAVIPSLTRRVEWKWAVDRAAVVSRWTWLQAQVSDLEYRIRQQSQVYRQLRNSKGGVVLGDPPSAADILRRLQGLPNKEIMTNEGKISASTTESSPGNEISPCAVSAVLSNIDKQALRLTKSLGNCLSPANSTLGSPAGSCKISPSNQTETSPAGSLTTDTDTTSENSPVVPSELRLQDKFTDFLSHTPTPPSDASCQAARCRPLRSYRKRKILKTIGLYKTSLKAARLSDLGCRCYPPSGTCPMCGGRYNNKQTIDADTMCFNERVAILDPSFHPVLSFPQDVHLPVHCEGLLKSGLWQNKPLSRKSRMTELRRQQKVMSLMNEPVRKSGNVKQNSRNNTASSVINFSAKIKNKYESKTKGKKKKAAAKVVAPVKRVKKKQRKAARLAQDVLKKHTPEDEDDLEALYLDQEVAPPAGSSRESLSISGSQSSLKDLRDSQSRRRKIDDSYDINNIVIPLSMAANTRVEQIQYKEIVTPKWREVTDTAVLECGDVNNPLSRLEKPNGVSNHLHQDMDDEDLSDEKFLARHSKLEQEEKKRFRNFVQYPVRRNRGRSEVNVDCVDSPGKLGDGLEVVSESEQSRPATPMLNKSNPFVNEEALEALQLQTASRRRTQSLPRRATCEDLHGILISNIEPWPRRTFPLSEDDYRLMKEDAPSSCEPVHNQVRRRLAEPSGKVYVGGIGGGGDAPEDVSAAPSPHPSNDSVSSTGDDPNDPEWIGAGGDSLTPTLKKIRHRRIIDDDPNDPEWNGSDHRKKGKNKR